MCLKLLWRHELWSRSCVAGEARSWNNCCDLRMAKGCALFWLYIEKQKQQVVVVLTRHCSQPFPREYLYLASMVS